MYTEESLDSLRQAIDIVEVLSEYISLKKAGSSYKACCPFHQEKTPSFIVNPTISRYHCFGCGESGDALAFLKQHLGYSFSEAAILLANKYHIKLEVSRKKDGEKALNEQKKNLLRNICLEAERIFCYCMQYFPEGHQAQRYLFSRGIGPDTIQRFRIGYAPDSKTFLQMCEEKHLQKELLQEAGILREQNLLFRHRIIFPIRDLLGRTIAFSSRKFLENSYGGKYVNSPETIIFKKSRTFFGVDLSRRRIAKEGRAILVEGQVDCLQMIEAGLDCTLATQGTSFGEDHVREIEKLGAKKLYLLFDGDEAGRAAFLKVGDLCQQVGISVFVCTLPKGEDPDSFLLSRGVENLIELLEKAEDYISYLLLSWSTDRKRISPEEKARIIESLTARIRKWNNPLIVHESLKKLASLMRVPERLVLGDSQLPRSLEFASTAFVRKTKNKGKISRDLVLETDVLRFMVLHKEERFFIFSSVLKYCDETFFKEPTCRSLFKTLSEHFNETGTPMDPENILQLIQEESLVDLLTKRLVKISSLQESLELVLQKLVDRQWKEKKQSLLLALKEKEQKGEGFSLKDYLESLGDKIKVSLRDPVDSELG